MDNIDKFLLFLICIIGIRWLYNKCETVNNLEHLADSTPTNAEAIQNVASLYNSSQITMTKFKITDELQIGEFILKADGNNLTIKPTTTNTTGKIISTPITANILGDVTGNITGNITGNVTGNVEGNVTGNVTGNTTGNVIIPAGGNITLNKNKSNKTAGGKTILYAGCKDHSNSGGVGTYFSIYSYDDNAPASTAIKPHITLNEDRFMKLHGPTIFKGPLAGDANATLWLGEDTQMHNRARLIPFGGTYTEPKYNM